MKAVFLDRMNRHGQAEWDKNNLVIIFQRFGNFNREHALVDFTLFENFLAPGTFNNCTLAKLILVSNNFVQLERFRLLFDLVTESIDKLNKLISY